LQHKNKEESKPEAEEQDTESMNQEDKKKGVYTLPQKATLLVCEILGTMLDGESCIHYYQDCRERLLAPNAKIIPSYGIQYCSVIASDQFKKITQAANFDGLDLSSFNRFRDCTSLVFSKNYGVLLNNLDFRELTEPMTLFEVDLTKDGLEVIPEHEITFTLDVMEDGEAVALMYWWEVFLDEERTIKISTHPNETKGNIPRDLNWGQGLQLIEGPDGWNAAYPTPCNLSAGQQIYVRFTCENKNGAVFHGRIMNEQQLEQIEAQNLYEQEQYATFNQEDVNIIQYDGSSVQQQNQSNHDPNLQQCEAPPPSQSGEKKKQTDIEKN